MTVKPGMTNFTGLTINGIPVVPGGQSGGGGSGFSPIETGNVFFVSSLTGSSGGDARSIATAANTLALALSKCVAGNGDVVYLLPGHAETITGAAGINVNVEGVSIVGCGNGDDKPTLTFSTSTAATMTITAADVTMSNFIVVVALDQIVSPIVVSAANCTLTYEHHDGAANKEAVSALLTTTAATNLKVNLKYVGFIAGTHCVTAIRLVAVTGAIINIDFYGKASTAVVEMLTNSFSVEVYGYMFNASVADGSKDVVDTGGSSKWFGAVYDGSAGAAYQGGSASAWGTVVTTNQAVPTANSTANATERDVIGNKTDAGVQTVTTNVGILAYTKGILDIIAGTTGIATYPAGAAYANAVSLAEVMAYVQDAVRNGSGAGLAANKSLVDALGTNGSATTYGAGSVTGAIGTSFWVKKTLVSSTIVAAGIDLTLASSGGALAIRDVVCQTNGTGLAGMTNFTIASNNANGIGIFFSTAITALGANGTADMANASTTKIHTVLESGKKLTAGRTTADGTGAGTVDVYIRFERLAEGATVAAA